jgi:preprotein translocase subunit SecE
VATKKNQDETTVTRISAADSRKSTTPAKAVAKTAKPLGEKKPRRNPVKAAGGYFAGAWEELRQVRWPNRKATWSLTGAMLIFTAFFVVLILLLDALFKYVFQLILG